MSQKTKSIADALKSSPLKRPSPVIDNSPVDEPKNTNRFSDSQSADYSNNSEETSEIVSELPVEDNNEREETTSSEDLIARLSRLQASSKDEGDEPSEENRYEEQPHRATSRQRQQRSVGQDRQQRGQASGRNVSQRDSSRNFQAESNYYHNQVNRRDESEDVDHEFPEKYTPRPLSPARRLNNSRYADEVKTPAVRRPLAPQPFRTSRRGAGRQVSNHDLPVRSPHRASASVSRFSEHDSEAEYPRQVSQTRPQAYPPSHSARPVTSRGRSVPAQSSSRYQAPAPRESFDHQWSTDSPEVERGLKSSQSSGFRSVGSAARSNVPVRNTQPRKFQSEDDYSDDLDQPQPERRERIPSSHENSIPFTGLSKTIVTKISKTVGISSLAADVHETLKELSGNFVYDVLSETSQVTDNVSSAELEPIVEAKLGRSLEDLDQSFLSANVFSRWVRGVTDELQIGIRNEAILFLQQVLEFYLVELLTNSRDVAEQAGRSRVMVKDILLASRMR